MATTASTEASDIRRRGRRRLIGAIALVVLAVVFVPMILDSEPRPKSNAPALEIPAKDSVPPLPAPTAASPATPVAPPVASAKLPDVPPAKPPELPPAKDAAPTPKLEGFAVQVGAFRDEDKLAQAREKLAFAGI